MKETPVNENCDALLSKKEVRPPRNVGGVLSPPPDFLFSQHQSETSLSCFVPEGVYGTHVFGTLLRRLAKPWKRHPQIASIETR